MNNDRLMEKLDEASKIGMRLVDNIEKAHNGN
jgi:hypothetical protein